jgi:tetratricopeptide (TPR) repeat protein
VIRWTIIKSPPNQALLTGSLLALFLFAGNLSYAEQIIDTEDPLTVSQTTTYERLKNGYFPDALSAGENALKIAEDRYGPTHPDIVPFLIDLATIHRYMARYADAETSLKWALAIQEKSFGPDDNPQTAGTLCQLAALYTDWGRWDDAEYFGKRAITLLEAKDTPPFTKLIQALNQQGYFELEMGNGDQAQELLKKSLQLQEKDLKADPAGMIQTLHALSQAYLLSKRFSDSKNALDKIMDITNKNFASNSVQQADALESLGHFYQSQNQTDKAKSLFEAALPIYQRFVGVYFGYSSLDYVRKLAKADESLGKNKEAEDLLQKSLQTLKEVFGDSHPRVALGLVDLAQVEEALGQKALAQEELKEALVIAQSFFGNSHPLVIKIQKQLRTPN